MAENDLIATDSLEDAGNPPAISRKEWFWVYGLTFFILFLTTIPFLVDAFNAPNGTEFVGIFPGDVAPLEDDGQYYAIAHGYQNHFLIDDRVTPETDTGYMFNTFWWLFAQISTVLHLSMVNTMHVVRVLATLFFAFVVYRTIALFLPATRDRRFAFWWILFPPNLVWLSFILQKFLPQIHEPTIVGEEENIFASFAAKPTYLLVASAIIFSIYSLHRLVSTKQKRYALYMALAMCGSISFHPFEWPLYMVIATLILLVAWYREKKSWSIWIQSWLCILILPLPLFLYWGLIPHLSFQFAQVVSQNYAHVDSPLGLFFLFGPSILVVALKFKGLVDLKNRSWSTLIISIWFISVIGCFYLPFLPWSWHILNGFIVCLAIGAVPILRPLVDWAWDRTLTRVLGKFFFILLSALPLLLNMEVSILRATAGQPGQYLYLYVNQDEKNAYNMLANNCREGTVLLTERSGAMVSITSACRPWVEHRILTLHYEERLSQAKSILTGKMPPHDVYDLLHKYQVKYVLEDKIDGADQVDLKTVYGLPVALSSTTVTVYSVPDTVP